MKAEPHSSEDSGKNTLLQEAFKAFVKKIQTLNKQQEELFQSSRFKNEQARIKEILDSLKD